MSHLRHLLASAGLVVAVPAFAADTAAGPGQAGAKSTDLMELEEVVVTGSRVRRPNLDSISPLTSLDAERFQVSAETNIVRQLQELPSFYPGRSPVSGSESGFTGSFVDLRGLGSTRTLVLVNGRRWINSVSTSAVDVSTIPPELIERVDVVTGGASATYGSDAVAGVVNIILKDDFDGLEFNSQTGVTDRGEATNTRYALTAGQEFGDARGTAYFHVSHDITEAISGARRSFLNPVVENVDGRLVPLNSPSIGSGFVALGEDTFATFDSNGELVNGSGEPNLVGADDLFNAGRYARVQIPAKKTTVATGVKYQLNDRATLYAEGIYIRDEVSPARSPFPADLSGLRVSVDNPFIGPNTRDLLNSIDQADDGDGFVELPLFLRRLNELGPRTEANDRDSYRVMAGVELDIGAGWKLDTSALYSESNFSILGTGFAADARLAQALDVIDTPNGPQCRVPTFAAQRCIPLNVFGPNTISPEAAAFISAEKGLEGTNTHTDVQSVLTGDLLALPAGNVGVALGVEYRKATAGEHPNEVWRYGLSQGAKLGDFSASLEQREAFGEAVVPLLSEQPGAHYLGLELGARFTKFDPGEDAWTHKILLQWAPIEEIRVRGGLQRATRAPNPYELGGADQEFLPLSFANDPCFTGDPLTGDLRAACIATGVPVAVADAGATLPPGREFLSSSDRSADLEPEVAKTWTIGLVVSDLGIDNLVFTADYYELDTQRVITRLGPEIITDQCYFSGTGGSDPLCVAITRDPTTGVLTQFNDGSVNGANFKVTGIDFSAQYSRQIPGLFAGDAIFAVAILANRISEIVFTPFAEDSSVQVDCTGLYGPQCPPTPQWKTSTELSWSEGPVSASLNWRWLDSIADSRTRFAPELLSELAKTKVSAKHYFDLDLVWQMTDAIALRGGVANILDTEPSIVGADRIGASDDNNTFPGMYDAVGRRYFMGVKVKFQ